MKGCANSSVHGRTPPNRRDPTGLVCNQAPRRSGACEGRRALRHPPAERRLPTRVPSDYDRLEKNEVYDRLEAAEGPYFYRLTLAPGGGRGTAVDLHDWTRHVMDRLEERAGDCEWIAWEHRDHSNHDHVHVIAVVDRRLDRDDLRDLRELAGDVWRQERERCRDPLDAELERTTGRDLGRHC